MSDMKKPTPEQMGRLRLIRHYEQNSKEEYCSRYLAGYPNGPMVTRMKEAGLITVVGPKGFYYADRGYNTTEAGRKALGE